MKPFLMENFGNPSSIYSIGQDAKGYINIAREKLAKLINANAKEIFFTGCGTESDNWVLNSVANMKKEIGKHIITTEFEHHAIMHTCNFLEKQGFEITYLKPDKKGIINPSDLEKAIRKDTILISIMLANNEIGTIQDIKKMVEIAKEKKILFHTDAVQALGNIKVDVKYLDVDFLSCSAHKIYGPKGVGALYIKRGVNLIPFINGGAQEGNKRAGTENVAGIIGFGKAAELAGESLEEHINKLTDLRNYFIDRLLKEVPDAYLNGDRERRLPGNVNITFRFIEGEALLLMLDMKGILISTGSACSSSSLTPSHVLVSIGNPIEEIHGSARFTIGDFTTKEELDYTIDILKETVKKLKEISALG
jgi:cysteine desulfurase